MKYIFVYCIIPCYRVFDHHALSIRDKNYFYVI